MKNKIQLFLTATLLCAVLPGCSSDHTDSVQIAAAGEEDSLDNSTSKESGEDLKVLIDYFDRVTGTPMELPYDRIILYESEEEDILCVYKDITNHVKRMVFERVFRNRDALQRSCPFSA